MKICIQLLLCIIFMSLSAAFTQMQAATYTVGPGKTYTNIHDIVWTSLNSGDTVEIYYRPTAYNEKWAITQSGINVIGKANDDGDLPVINVQNARTYEAQVGGNGDRDGRGGIIINNANNVTIKNLKITGAYQNYNYKTYSNGASKSYDSNAAAIYVAAGKNILIENCWLDNSSNGLKVDSGTVSNPAYRTANLTVRGCTFSNNGNYHSSQEHNSYTESVGITFEYNHYGPLRTGAWGNSLKDRSAGTVIRYNWIEEGSHLLDLVQAEDSTIYNAASYDKTYVYGNIFIKKAVHGNNIVVHYGGDATYNATKFRNGTLYLYNNTLYANRNGTANDGSSVNKTIFVSFSGSTGVCDARNNVLHNVAGSLQLFTKNHSGTMNLYNNWVKTGANYTGATKKSGNLEGSDPKFTSVNTGNYPSSNFKLKLDSPCLNKGIAVSGLPGGALNKQFIFDSDGNPTFETRPTNGTIDIGAYERQGTAPPDPDPDPVYRYITITLPDANNVADISPAKTPSVSGNTYTFSGLNKDTTYTISISPAGVN